MMKIRNKYLCVPILLMVILTIIPNMLPNAQAQTGEVKFLIPISPTPVGSGARALGMANAFVGVADDATAASWNPAGLVQLEKAELSIVGSFENVNENFRSNSHSEIEQTFRDDLYDLNFASAVYPIPDTIAGKNAVVSISYQKKYDLARNHNFPFQTQITDSSGLIADIDQDFRVDLDGTVSTISPAFGIELTSTLSVGVAINFWHSSYFSDNSWTQSVSLRRTTSLSDSNGNPVGNEETRLNSHAESSNFHGDNYTFGILWNVRPRWNIGVLYDTKFTGKVSFEQSTLRDGVLDSELSENRKITFPATFAVGTSWRVNDRLTLSMDLSTTDWNDMYVEIGNGKRISLVDATDRDDAEIATDFDRTWTVRLGAEYVLIPKNIDSELHYLWTLRGGLFYDEEPASGRKDIFEFDTKQRKGDGDPDVFYGFTLGVGLLAHHRVNIDFAYELRKGDGVNADLITGLPGFEEDFLRHQVLLSAVVYFN